MSISAGKWALGLSILDTVLVAAILGSDVITHQKRDQDHQSDTLSKILTALDQGKIDIAIDPKAKGEPWYAAYDTMLNRPANMPIDLSATGGKSIPVMITNKMTQPAAALQLELSPTELRMAALASQHAMNGELGDIAASLEGQHATLTSLSDADAANLNRAIDDAVPSAANLQASVYEGKAQDTVKQVA